MSTSFWILFLVIGGICAAVFAKTVSNDAKNDYKLRDILSNTDNETFKEEEIHTNKTMTAPMESTMQAEHEPQEEPVPAGIYEEKNIYEEIAQEQKQSYAYTTNTHSTDNKESQIQQEESNNYNTSPNYESEPVYYEKINDDACEVDDQFEEDYEEIEEDLDRENVFGQKAEYKPAKKINSLFNYVKTFWRGITFSLGLLVCLYSFYGIATQVQTSNDAIVFSIWLLIGVILIK